jgi:hypothetical protein
VPSVPSTPTTVVIPARGEIGELDRGDTGVRASLATATAEVDVGVNKARDEARSAEIKLLTGEARGEGREVISDGEDLASRDQEIAEPEGLRGVYPRAAEEPEHPGGTLHDARLWRQGRRRAALGEGALGGGALGGGLGGREGAELDLVYVGFGGAAGVAVVGVDGGGGAAKVELGAAALADRGGWVAALAEVVAGAAGCADKVIVPEVGAAELVADVEGLEIRGRLGRQGPQGWRRRRRRRR